MTDRQIKNLINTIANVVFAVGLFLVIGTVGGIEYGSITLTSGIIRLIPCVLVMAVGSAFSGTWKC